ncbi:single-stranded-DNA-specific exonuclease RecJ [Candidatus Schneideria nysicola]|uniref:single-stranded-DNA-specific exonuclease RecJ n=1 Tax=Candidatus Schneideria nysicola TaxID=1081631 RepID=UPI001CAA4C83|nr:single-stranded-DNA-specific exonuclease RecJ [Candidatus Schneideria nysicola]UAJ65355.1 single-stranded-DNA-specific exonuclease RecJ [Candidatus Schneideria nysicola]
MDIQLKHRKIKDTILWEKDKNIPPLLKRIYAQRGINNINQINRSTQALLSYQSLNNIDKAVHLLAESIIKDSRLVIIGDFDVDGATSVALVILALRKMGAKYLDFLIPNRFIHGYGLSTKIVEEALMKKAEIILTVDNGISSYDGINLALDNNIKVLITDHHIPPNNNLPPANVIINPNLMNSNFASKYLSGVGVAFYLMLALRAFLKQQGWFIQKNISIPNLAEFLDLVALGTVADVVKLDTNNRILVYQGICRIRAGKCRLGIRKLVESIHYPINILCEKDLSFLIVPRLNAAGRLDDMSLSVKLLLAEDRIQIHEYIKKLDYFNRIRKKIGKQMEVEAMKMCNNSNYTQKDSSGLVIYHPKWHQGLIGIIASRIKDHFSLPVIVFAPAEDNILKGSGRSIIGLNLYHIIEKIKRKYPNKILNFGGHAMAVGLSIIQKDLEWFRSKFTHLLRKSCVSMNRNIIWSDGKLSKNELSFSTAELLRYGGPWGNGFPEPIFDGNFKIISKKNVKGKYFKFILESIDSQGIQYDAIAFHMKSNLFNEKDNVKLAYSLNIKNYKQNKTIQLIIHYIWPLELAVEN